MSDSNSNSGGCCFGSTAFTLFIVFLVLKLVHVIDWSWWWVTSPLWISAGLTMGFVFGLALLSALDE